MGTICSKSRLGWTQKPPNTSDIVALDPRIVEFELHFQNLKVFSLKKACKANISEERDDCGRIGKILEA